MKRIFLIVLDSVGIGEMLDAAEYGDAGSNTLLAVSKSPYFSMPNLRSLGFFNIDGINIGEKAEHPRGSFARLAELSRGKDTTIGHWEIAGVVSPAPLPTYPKGFPRPVIEAFKKKTGSCRTKSLVRSSFSMKKITARPRKYPAVGVKLMYDQTH